jgi:two-component system chemotaxis sensor kinase CheA
MEDAALFEEFRIEAQEHLTRVADGLVRLERCEGAVLVEEVNGLFRALHSIKGSAGFLGLRNVELVAHAAETLLDRVRKGQQQVSTSLIDLLLQVNDRLIALVEDLEASNSADVSSILDRLKQALESNPSAIPEAPKPESTHQALPTLIQPAGQDEKDPGSHHHLLLDPDRGRTIRIPVAVADRLMTLASELVLVRNQALKRLEPRDAAERELVQRLSTVTSDIQRTVTSTRMQPVGTLFQRFPRVVREISRQLGKTIDLVLQGTEVELDKGVIERLADPLTHLIRNACDHGIESPAARLKAGKQAMGTVKLIALHEGSLIHVIVEDDGGGIDPAKVGRKAVERGLLAEEERVSMTASRLQSLILRPGFSTAEVVTDLSGRGVGLDVVQSNIEAIGGSLQIESELGHGTKFHLRLPLTLAIIPCLVVEAGEHRLCVPQRDIKELVLLDGTAKARLEMGHDRQVFRLRDQLIPVVALAELLGSPVVESDAPRFLAVVRGGSGCLGLVIDAIRNPEEIVVKPLHAALESLDIFAGSTVMGDGQVSLILDMEGVAREAGIGHASAAVVAQPLAKVEEVTLVLLFEDGAGARYAIPLDAIRRVVRFKAADVQYVTGRAGIRLPDGIWTMRRLEDVVAGVAPVPIPDAGYLLLPKATGGDLLGLVLAELIDTALAPKVLQPVIPAQVGVMGVAEVCDKLTLFLDPAVLLGSVEGGR